MKRISFIEAGAPGLHVFSKFPAARVGTVLLSTILKEMKDSGRLLHTDWSKYDAHHAVFSPSLMSAQTLQTETLKGMGRFYS